MPDWNLLGGPVRTPAPPEGSGATRVLLATNVGSFLPGTILESLLGAALSLRGAECHVLLCDSALPACLACEYRFYGDAMPLAEHGPQDDLCRVCFDPAAACFRGLGLTVHRYSDLLTPGERDEARRTARDTPIEIVSEVLHDGLRVGEHAMAGALRFFARGDLDGELYAEPVVRRYLEAALLTASASRRLLGQGFSVAVFHHGIYVPQGVIGEVARSLGVRVVNWNPAYRKQCFIFSHSDTYHHTLMDEPVSTWEDLRLTPEQEEQIVAYLRSRWDGRHDWITFQAEPRLELEEIERETGIDFSKPTVVLLTNVVWDAQLHYPANAFPNMLDWLLGTIAYFQRRPDLQLVIRVHPAEVTGSVPSRQLAEDEIRSAFGELPDNVFVIPPTSRVSTYVVAHHCNCAIIYGTKMGVELTSFGIPTIVAGEAWIRGKGITRDATSRDEYFRMLDTLPLRARLDDATIRRARVYAYHFFYRRMIPLDCVRQREGWPPFELSLDDLDALRPEADPGLDVICEGILSGAHFVYPAERYAPSGER